VAKEMQVGSPIDGKCYVMIFFLYLDFSCFNMIQAMIHSPKGLLGTPVQFLMNAII